MQSRITTRRQDDEQQGTRTAVSYEKYDGPVDDERWTAGDILQGWAEYRGYGERGFGLVHAVADQILW